MSDTKTCLFIGRFQPFHRGHMMVVTGMTKVCEKVIIGVGSSDKSGSKDDPFTFDERRDMIQRALQGVDIIPKFDVNIIPLPDHESDEEWTKHVMEKAGEVNMLWTGKEWTKKCFEGTGLEIKDIKEVPGISATDIRHKMATDGDWKPQVPDEVAAVIKAIDGVDRVKKMS